MSLKTDGFRAPRSMRSSALLQCFRLWRVAFCCTVAPKDLNANTLQAGCWLVSVWDEGVSVSLVSLTTRCVVLEQPNGDLSRIILGCFFFPMLDHQFVFFFSIGAQLWRGVFLETRKQTLTRQMLGKTGAGPLSTQWTSGRRFSEVQSGEKVAPRAPSPPQTQRRSQPRR